MPVFSYLVVSAFLRLCHPVWLCSHGNPPASATQVSSCVSFFAVIGSEPCISDKCCSLKPELQPTAPGGNFAVKAKGPRPREDPGARERGLKPPSRRDDSDCSRSLRTRFSFSQKPSAGCSYHSGMDRESYRSRKTTLGKTNLELRDVAALSLPLALDPPGTELFLEQASPCLQSPRPRHWGGGGVGQAAGVGGSNHVSGLIITRHLGCPQALPPYMDSLDPWWLLSSLGRGARWPQNCGRQTRAEHSMTGAFCTSAVTKDFGVEEGTHGSETHTRTFPPLPGRSQDCPRLLRLSEVVSMASLHSPRLLPRLVRGAYSRGQRMEEVFKMFSL